jgi:hypothetical protein
MSLVGRGLSSHPPNPITNQSRTFKVNQVNELFEILTTFQRASLKIFSQFSAKSIRFPNHSAFKMWQLKQFNIHINQKNLYTISVGYYFNNLIIWNFQELCIRCLNAFYQEDFFKWHFETGYFEPCPVSLHFSMLLELQFLQ